MHIYQKHAYTSKCIYNEEINYHRYDITAKKSIKNREILKFCEFCTFVSE